MDLNSSGESCYLEDDSTDSDDSSNESPGSSPEKSKGGSKRRGRQRSITPIVPLKDPKEGDVVWAKVKNSRWWPAMVVSKEDCGNLPFSQRGIRSCHFVYWFGDERVSSVAISNLVDFKKGFQQFITPCGKKSFRSGVYLAIKEIRRSLLLDTDDYDVTKAWDWAENGFPLPKEYCDDQINDTVSEHVQNKLKILRVKYEETEEEDEEDEPEDSTFDIEISTEEEDMMHSVRDETINLDDICLACLSQIDELRKHPLFHGSICNPCMEKLLYYSFSIGLDMIAFHCSICMNSGQMMVCSQPYCYRAFCSKCIILKATLGVIECIQEADPWSCFMCTPFTSEMHGLLKPRSPDWKENMREAFHSGITSAKKLEEISLRILCLDGSCNTVVVILSILKKLDANIDALFLCNFNGSEMERLDPIWRDCAHPIKSMNEYEGYEALSSLGPIHILIASPEDIEKESFGTKFFSSYNILSMLDVLNQSCIQPSVPLMWIFEMPPPYWEDYMTLITRYLQLDPAAWSVNQSKEEHLVWTNITAVWPFLEEATTLLKKYQPEPRNKKLYRVESYD